MKITQKRITPEMATRWLEGNTHNRPIQQEVVDRYTRDMREGNWTLTHQGIAFDPTGVLLDGQHRLFAIIESGVTIEMMVTEGMDPAAQEHLDGGVVRQARDVLALRGEMAHTVAVAIAKLFYIQLTGNYRPTRAEQVDTYMQYKDAILFAHKLFPRRVKKIWIAAVLAVFARASYTQDREKLTQAAAVLADGMATTAADKTLIVLRNWLLEGMRRKPEIYGKTERAIQAYLTGEKLSTLYMASEELFPLPIESAKGKPRAKRAAAARKSA